MKLETLITIFAFFWVGWYIFFAMGIDLFEIGFTLFGIEYNEILFLLVHFCFIVGFLGSFLWLKRAPKKDVKFAEKVVP